MRSTTTSRPSIAATAQFLASYRNEIATFGGRSGGLIEIKALFAGRANVCRRLDRFAEAMRIGRAIVAVLVAVAVALLPVASSAVSAAKIDGAVAVDMTAPVEADQGTPCDHGGKAIDDCVSLSACALKCFAYAGTALPRLAIPLMAMRIARAFASDDVVTRAGAPPFRPPRL
jgi:hypothetical protein